MVIIALVAMVGCGGAWASRSAENHCTNSLGPGRVIDQFWSAALSDNQSAINDIVTEVPADFFDLSNKCGSVGTTSASSPSDRVVFPAVGDNERRIEAQFINKIANKIRTKAYRNYTVTSENIIGNHALVNVRYGRDSMLDQQNLFLFYLRNSEWKLFMITTSTDLRRINKYYESESCD